MMVDAAPGLPAPREPEIQVEAYRGPFDLLLHLIKEEEVDVYDIPIARILERYLRTIEQLPELDINAAAEFILLAATLMEIKSRQMLPPEERQALELEEEDPRTDLVRQLLEYRRFREAADEFGALAARRALLAGRAAFGLGLAVEDKPAADPAGELREVNLYDLMSSFERLMRAILDDLPRTIVYDDVSVEERIEELKLALAEAPQISFREFLKSAADKADAAGMFVALLEAVRRRIATIFQPEPAGEIYVQLRGERPDSEFAPSAEEQEKLPTAGTLAARKGAFTGFLEPEEEEADDERDFAGDAEGRKAIRRLEEATRRAEEAVQRFAGASKGPPAFLQDAAPPVIRQWTDGEVSETGAGSPPEGEAVPVPGTGAESAEAETEPDVESDSSDLSDVSDGAEAPEEAELFAAPAMVAPAVLPPPPPLAHPWTDAELAEPVRPPTLPPAPPGPLALDPAGRLGKP
jgi:segregation and condensation protein A